MLEIENYDAKNCKGCCPVHNEKTPSFIFNPKLNNFHCFSYETKVITKDGIRQIGDIINKNVEIINGNGEWETVRFVDCGKQNLQKITLLRYGKIKTVYATPEHEWLVNKYGRGTMVVSTQELRNGNRLEKQWYRRNGDITPDVNGLIHGFIYGNGHLIRTNKNGETGYGARICTQNKYEFCKKYFTNISPPTIYEKDKYYGYYYTSSHNNLKSIPEYTKSNNYLMGFIIGYLVAAGNFSNNAVAITSSNKDDLLKIQYICTLLGIPSYSIGESMQNIEKNKKFIKINKLHTTYTLRLIKEQLPVEIFSYTQNNSISKNKSSSFLGFKVVSVEQTNRFENVYCCETSTHSFVLEDFILTRNCFGCGCTIDIIDAYMLKGNTYVQAVQKLFELVDMQYSFGEVGIKTKGQYYYPVPKYAENNDHMYEYLKKRKISQNTADYLGLRQNHDGNILIQYYDLNDVLTMVKVRKSAPVPHGEVKCWYLKDDDGKPFGTSNLLYNMNRVNYEKPLLITSGEMDCAAAIEAGYLNAVSIPMGDQNTHWVDECLEFLDKFDNIIICPDNDASGSKYCKDIVPRLGSWKCRIACVPLTFTMQDGTVKNVKDLNECLYYFGKEKVFEIINNAKDTPVPSVKDLSDVQDIDLDEIDGVDTGIETIDKELMRLFYGTLTILSGSPGCVDCETEYFNGYKWKKINEYTPGEKVLQYDTNGMASLVNPIQYHKYPCNSFWQIKTKYGIDQMVSDEHNIVYKTSKGNIAKKNMLDLIEQHYNSIEGFSGKFITNFIYNGSGISLTDSEIKVMCAVICDGFFPKGNEDNNYCRINLKKERKKIRLEQLLHEAQIEYTKHKYNPNDSEYDTYYFKAPIITKVFGRDWFNCSYHQLQIISNEILFWDGNITDKRETYLSCEKQNADFIQFVFSSTGYRSTITKCNRVGGYTGKYQRKSIEYIVNRTYKTNPTLGKKYEYDNIKKVVTGDGYKYCFTVPSGMLVLRRNGRINITGNSGKSSIISQIICNTLDQGKNCWLFSGELPEYMTKNWLNYIFAGNRNIKEYQKQNGDKYYKISSDVKNAIDNYYRGRWFVYRDDWDNNLDTLLNSMTDVVRKYGVKLLILDNMMTIDTEDNENELKEQTITIKKLIAFSKKYSVATILVCHPRKLNNTATVGIYDISGSSNITNLAHRTIGMRRVTPEEKDGTDKMSTLKKSLCKYDVVVNIIKDRLRGRSNISKGLYYDIASRRFFSSPEEYSHQYLWDPNVYTDELPYPIKDDIEAQNLVN